MIAIAVIQRWVTRSGAPCANNMHQQASGQSLLIVLSVNQLLHTRTCYFALTLPERIKQNRQAESKLYCDAIANTTVVMRRDSNYSSATRFPAQRFHPASRASMTSAIFCTLPVESGNYSPHEESGLREVLLTATYHLSTHRFVLEIVNRLSQLQGTFDQGVG